ncbi:3-oxoacyl-ACP synthase [Nocardiopsis sp. RSe5-2]|uniref:3-oxoacyl-ACP synthase n=1 Tax=Nocardiopsis endophytica TaxID=3018445 RepID=A0ABT4TXH6_9ACTN|nr:3-oxoacyl-[acyl-carrier-protein] synthase III C-terminal domain-containing protein [Nocardiopsis endophytica]MDA2809380.1 3-oxoacyl-ACP synthase [Nocardiopsis endophytica]
MTPSPAVGIEAAAVLLPEHRDRAEAAVEAGRMTPRQAHEVGHRELPASRDLSAPDMAAAAADEALRRARVDGKELDTVCHAWMYYQGHDLWSPAHYIAHRVGAHRAVPFGVQQVCNGGAAAIDLVGARLAARAGERDREAGAGAAVWGLSTTGDRFSGPGFDRWASDYGVGYGDGGTALVLRSPVGPQTPLAVLAMATVAAPELEAMHRGSDAFAEAARDLRPRVDMRATKRDYLRRHGGEGFARVNEESIVGVTEEALQRAGLEAADGRIRRALLPRFGRKTLEGSWIPLLRERLRADLVDVGADTGHLGAGDTPAGVADLLEGDRLEPGEVALVYSAGAGFTWSCLVLQAPQR